MKRFIPIFIVILLLAGASYFLLFNDEKEPKSALQKELQLEDFNKVRSCATLPPFLYQNGIRRPIIDLSQQRYKGVAFLYGPKFSKVLHKKTWERFDALGTYTIDKYGNIYLTPNPYISITPATFNLQKAIYKMDKTSGKLERWMVLDDVMPTANNPYGLISILYDCKDGTLWASAIDKSDYKGSKGRIYHIDPKSKEIIEKIENVDALTLAWLYTKKSRYLLMGSALDNGLYAFVFKNGKVVKKARKLFELPNPKLHIRKIKVIGKNKLYLEAIKFTYSLIAETAKKQRTQYIAQYDSKLKKWEVKELKQ